MTAQQNIAVSAQVEARDGHFGVVEDVLVQPHSGKLAWLLVRRDRTLYMIPADSIVEARGTASVRLAGTVEDTLVRARTVASANDNQTVRVPVYEERLRVSVEPVDLGELRIHKRVEQEPEIVTRSVERDELVFERVKLDRLIDEPVSTREEDGWLIVPIMEEVLVVTKQLVLTEEVRISTRRVVEEQEVYEELRRERVEIEDATAHGVHGLSQPPGVRRSDPQRPVTEDAAGTISGAPHQSLEDPRPSS